jgi:hypothetical protein
MTTWADRLISRFIGLIVMAFLVAVLASQTAQAADISWSAAISVETGTKMASSAKMAVDPNGNIMAVWVQLDENAVAPHIYANRYVVGSGWGTPTLLETSDLPAASPQVAFDPNGNAIAVWRQAWKTVNGERYGIYANRYVAGTGWGTAIAVYADTRRDYVSTNDPYIAMDSNGSAMVVWSLYDWSWNHMSVMASRYAVGAGWGAVTEMPTGSESAYGPQVVSDPAGNAIVVWSQNIDSGSRIFANRYAAGTGWGTPQAIGDGPVGWRLALQIAIDPNGNAMTLWGAPGTGMIATRYVVGQGWGTGVAISDNDSSNTAYDEGTYLAFDKNGNAIAVWNQTGGKFYANRYVAGSGWGTTTILYPSDQNYSAKVAFDSNGNAVIVWAQYSRNSRNIWATRYVVGQGWGTPSWDASIVNVTKDNAGDPQIVIDKNGTATVAWSQNGNVYSASASAYTNPSDCVFSWAERTYPTLFAPPTASTSGPLYYRYYSQTKAYLFVFSATDHLYYFGPLSSNTVLDVGSLSTWITTARCQ